MGTTLPLLFAGVKKKNASVNNKKFDFLKKICSHRKHLVITVKYAPASILPWGAEMFQRRVEGGDQQQGDTGGEENAEAEADGHGNQKLSLDAGF